MSSIEETIAKFPVKVLPVISSKPTYESIHEMMQMLFLNSATLPTTLRGRMHGHIRLIMKTMLYATIATTNYVAPHDPGILPVFLPGNFTNEWRAQVQAAHHLMPQVDVL